MNHLVRAKCKEIVNLQDTIKTDELHYRSKHRKIMVLTNILYLLIVFLRDIHEGYLSFEDPDDRQSNFAAKLKNLDKRKKQLKKSFLE